MVPPLFCQPFYLLRGDTGLADALPIFSDMVVVKVSFYQETSGRLQRGDGEPAAAAEVMGGGGWWIGPVETPVETY